MAEKVNPIIKGTNHEDDSLRNTWSTNIFENIGINKPGITIPMPVKKRNKRTFPYPLNQVFNSGMNFSLLPDFLNPDPG